MWIKFQRELLLDLKMFFKVILPQTFTEDETGCQLDPDKTKYYQEKQKRGKKRIVLSGNSI